MQSSMRKILHIFSAALFMGLAWSCGDKTSPNSAQARAQARQAAATVLAIERADTFAMQEALLEASAKRSEYEIMGDTIAAGDFNRAFLDTIAKVDPQLAKELSK